MRNGRKMEPIRLADASRSFYLVLFILAISWPRTQGLPQNWFESSPSSSSSSNEREALPVSSSEDDNVSTNVRKQWSHSSDEFEDKGGQKNSQARGTDKHGRDAEDDTEITRLIGQTFGKADTGLFESDEWTFDDDKDPKSDTGADTQRNFDTRMVGAAKYDANPEVQQGRRRLFQHFPNRDRYSQEDSMQSDGRIVFPTDTPAITRKPSRPLAAPSCAGKTYCEHVYDYPEHLVSRALEENPSLKYLVGDDLIVDIAQRIDVNNDIALCRSEEKLIHPKTALSKNNEWLYIANTGNLTQGVRIETCTTAGKKCDEIIDAPDGYRTTCQQKHIYRHLAAIAANGSAISEWFSFPSSCCCHVERREMGNKTAEAADYLLRMGVNLGTVFVNKTGN